LAALSEAGRLAPAAPGWSAHPIASWLVDHGGRRSGLTDLLHQLCQKLQDEGFRLLRVHVGLRSTHPEIIAQTVVWTRGSNASAQVDHGYGMILSSGYQHSPVRLIHEGAGAFRRRLEGPQALRDFPVLDELTQQGCTDYVIMPLRFASGQINFISWATDRRGGFSTAELTLLYDLLPLLALRLEIEMAYQNAETLVATYLGRGAARRVLAGSVRRGEVERIRAAIWVSDLRGFTRLSDRLPTRQVIAVLNDYFDVMARAIGMHGGEILKFVGDGVLAIFNAGATSADDCANALTAARQALARLRSDNDERAAEGLPAIRCGIGLHLGEVEFGNIGARDRLDFTVIGPAVNEAVRVETLCKVLERPLLVSAGFAEAAGQAGLESVGWHVLRGVSTPRELFAPRRQRET
jgi:adenylate cyclase